MTAGETSANLGLQRHGWGALVLFVGLCLLAGGAGGWLTASSVDSWYPDLSKPAWNPPKFVFGPVWTLLFIMMGVSAWMVWRRRRLADIRGAMGLFGVQLALNMLWSALFFGLRQPGLALFEIVLLWLAIALTLRAFGRISNSAGWLLVPYLAWVTFAAALNLAIWRLNP